MVLKEKKFSEKLKLTFFLCLATLSMHHILDDSILSSLLCKPVRQNVLSSVFEMKLFEFMDVDLSLFLPVLNLLFKMIPSLHSTSEYFIDRHSLKTSKNTSPRQ